MATQLDITAEIPKEVVANFVKACSRYKDELGNTQRVAIRRGTINLLKSLRSRTEVAKKMIKRSDVKKYDGPGPHYITPHRSKVSYHRYVIRKHHKGEMRDFIYAGASAGEVWRLRGKIKRHKLAKKTWGWFMASLFHRAAPNDNPDARVDSRMTDGYINEFITGPNPRVEVLIVNKLDYITAALPSGALEDSMRAATNSINKQIDDGLAKARKELD